MEKAFKVGLKRSRLFNKLPDQNASIESLHNLFIIFPQRKFPIYLLSHSSPNSEINLITVLKCLRGFCDRKVEKRKRPVVGASSARHLSVRPAHPRNDEKSFKF